MPRRYQYDPGLQPGSDKETVAAWDSTPIITSFLVINSSISPRRKNIAY
jgi:hypothetical protein